MATRNGNQTEEPKDNPASTPENGKNSSGSMPSYLENALRLPTSYPLGAKRVDTQIASTTYGTDDLVVSHTMPVDGIMVLDYLPTLGVSADVTSALNRAMLHDFNIVRSNISGSRKYMSSDMMIARTAIDSLRDLYLYAQRIYYTLPKFEATNLYKPYAILAAMGLDPEDWYSNAANLLIWLNTHKSSLVPFPTAPMGNITSRHNVFNMVYYRDGDIDSTQTYIINQVGFWSYEVVDEVKGLTLREFPATFAEFTAMWDEMYAAMCLSTDIEVICADIRRAYGDKVITELPETTINGVVGYEKVDDILTMLMNANILPHTTDKAGISEVLKAFRISDDIGVLKCTPNVSMGMSFGDEDYRVILAAGNLSHLNFTAASPTSQDIWSALRLKPDVDVSWRAYNNNDISSDVVVNSMGTEVCVGARYVHYDEQGEPVISEFSGVVLANVDNTYAAKPYKSVNELVDICGHICNFDWHPPVVMAVIASTIDGGSGLVDVPEVVVTVEDVQNYVPIRADQIRAIHDAALLHEFGVN